MARRHTHWLFKSPSVVPNIPTKDDCFVIPTHIENLTVQGFAKDVPPFAPGVGITHKIWGFARSLENNPSNTDGLMLIATYETLEDIDTTWKYDHCICLGAMRFERIGIQYILESGVISTFASISVQ